MIGSSKQEWVARIGEEAVEHRTLWIRCMLFTIILGVPGFILLADHATNDTRALLALGSVLYTLAVGAGVCSWVQFVRLRRAISNALGIPMEIYKHRLPPRRQDRFVEWCRMRGIEPYHLQHHSN